MPKLRLGQPNFTCDRRCRRSHDGNREADSWPASNSGSKRDCPDATVETTTTEAKEASVTALGLPTRSYDIRISTLDTSGSGSCFVEVFDEDETLIVSGGGTNEVDALLEVILYMLPRHHLEYPQSTPTLDDE
jgi:hypothetical protein